MGTSAQQGARPGPVRLLDVELDLADAVPSGEAASAARASSVNTVVVPRGGWPDASEFAGTTLFVIGGVLVGRRSLGDYESIELVGPGRLFSTDSRGTTPSVMRWTAIEQAWIAVLDTEFWRAVAPYPTIAAALVGRGLDRADALATRLAIARSGAMTERVLGLLWELAGLRGKVVPEGTLVDLPVSTTLLAELLPGSRSRVSRALGELIDSGRVSRRGERRLVINANHPGQPVVHLSSLWLLMCAIGNTAAVPGVS